MANPEDDSRPYSVLDQLSKERVEHRERNAHSEGDALFKELSRSLLVGHGAIIAIAINAAVNLAGRGYSTPIASIVFTSAVGLLLTAFALLGMARRLQTVSRALELFLAVKYGTLDPDQVSKIKKKFDLYKVESDLTKDDYVIMLGGSLLFFFVSLAIAVWAITRLG